MEKKLQKIKSKITYFIHVTSPMHPREEPRFFLTLSWGTEWNSTVELIYDILNSIKLMPSLMPNIITRVEVFS